MTNLNIYFDTIVFDSEWMILSYESFAYAMNFISEFCNLEYHRYSVVE